MSKLSENIKNLRTLRGLSQKQLADKIQRAPNTISNWEKGAVTPDADVLEDLCEIFQVNPNQLFGWEPCQELDDFLREKKEIIEEMESLQMQKAQLEKRIREYSEMLTNHRK